jgi:iron complex outermembrane recepter protein
MSRKPTLLPTRGIAFTHTRLALAISAICASSAFAASDPQDPASDKLEEIQVTANRRTESVQDVPYNISVIGATAINDAGVSDAQELIRLMPGVSSIDFGGTSAVNNQIIMRGISANSGSANNLVANLTQAPVSIYFNETPVDLNFNLTDIKRVEVLRGPQGTLYGAGSVGGTIRFIFNKPDPTEASFYTNAEVSRSKYSSSENYKVDFVGNLPLGEHAAFRLSAGDSWDAGVTDATGLTVLNDQGFATQNPLTFTPQNYIDYYKLRYARASALWNVADNTEVVLTYFNQEENSGGGTYSELTNGSATQGNPWQSARRYVEPLTNKSNLGTLEITSNLGFASLVSSTSYVESQLWHVFDETGEYQSFVDAGAYAGWPNVAATTTLSRDIHEVTQEIRLVSQLNGKWNWVAGAFYNRDHTNAYLMDDGRGFQNYLETTPNPYGPGTLLDYWNTFSNRAPYGDLLYYSSSGRKFQDEALFGETSYHFTDAWQLTLGARAFHQTFTLDGVTASPYCGIYCSDVGAPNGSSAVSNTEDFNDHIFRINTSYDFNPDTKTYFTWSQGYRHGGANAFPLTGFAAVSPNLAKFYPDFVTNWEIGLKGNLGNNVQYTVAGFFMQWRHIQIDTYLGALYLPGVINAADAQSKGVEAELNWRLTHELLLTAGANYTHAVLTQDADIGGSMAYAGDKLPSVPTVEATLVLDYRHPLSNGATLQADLNGSYRGRNQSALNDNFSSYAVFSPFSIWNISVNYLKNGYSVGAFVKNIGNEQAETASTTQWDSYEHVGFIGRPLTAGVRFSYRFP